MSPLLERGARTRFDLKDRVGRLMRSVFGSGKKAREENQIKDDPKRIAAVAVRPAAHLLGLTLYDASLI
jgi:hypothetical protein